MEDIIKITCTVEKVRFHKDSWGIILVSVDRVKDGEPKKDKDGYVVLKGQMPKVKIGDMLNVTAEYILDPKWGDQYNITSLFYAITFDSEDKVGQKKFLLSIFTPLQVKCMYEVLDDPFMTLKNKDAKSLVKVKNCGMKTAVRWIDKFDKNYFMIKIFTELEEYNLTNNMVERLINRYKSPELVIEKVKNNPYILCTEVDGIGWIKADKIALDGGMGFYSPERVSAFIKYYLKNSAEDGRSWVTSDELLGAIIENLGEEIPNEAISEGIHFIESALWWNEDKTKIGLKKYRILSDKIAKELIRIRDAETEITYGDWENDIRKLEQAQGWEFTAEQKDGVQTALSNNIALILGLAGTGKSTLVRALLEVLKGYDYVQCALSGRAAARMSEITGKEGMTIHRLLGFPTGKPEHGCYWYHEDEPLPYDIYIVDEISMVGAELFLSLLRAIPSGSKLIFLGDPGQLESIGCGNVAYDMMKSPEVPTVMLTKIHRQAEKSAIITESRKVRDGQQIVPKDWAGEETRGELQDLTLVCYQDISNTYYEVMKAFSILMATEGFDIIENQIITPVKSKGASCTQVLNNAIQELCNPASENKKEETVYSKGATYIIREGDKVINTENNYNTEPNIFNGNIGIVKEFTFNEEGEYVMVIDFMGIGQVELEKKYWKGIELGYAITVHRMQGSQFDNIIFALDFSAYALLSRELLYTGITRAKKKIKIVAQTGALRMATAKEGVSKKQTHLQQSLYDETHPKLIF